MGRIYRGMRCSVSGCDKDAIRSLATNKVVKAGFRLENDRRAYLCKDHYKELKKKSRKDRILERWRMMK